ncbi:MAG TPA: DUF2911 domain-containing protein [Thermoanaerobaculia bacterium]|nr:DUF2911 domain-containing protein [Thermoanaerobaculia bacterium]
MKTFALLALLAVPALAQFPPLMLPEASPEASVAQTVGLTKLSITYHRPAVNGRKVWGELVPYGEVWRAGANQNTTITFSSPVSIDGKQVDAGTYGLHMIPTESAWTIILSKESAAWGSYSYDPKEDALRVTVTPQAAESTERLRFTFDDPTDDAVIVAMQWEKLRVAFKVNVDTQKVTLGSVREQMRGLPRFFWQGWNQAAIYALRNGSDLDEALAWADESLKIQTTFQNLRTKAAILEKKGDAKQAGELRARALTIANEADLNSYGYMLLGQKKVDEAIDVFKRNVKEHPTSWNVYDSLADAYSAKGDKKLAIENYNKALSLTSDPDQKKRITEAIKKLASS